MKHMKDQDRVFLVSACLLGVACRYNGSSGRNDRVIEFMKDRRFVPVCPESLSGLPFPRPPAEFDHGDGTTVRSGKNKIVMHDGADVTKYFLKGAAECIKMSRLARATDAVLKDRSPSCGVYQVYNSGKLVRGVGVLTAMLLMEGVAVQSERDMGE